MPTLIAVNETCLNKSFKISFLGYIIVDRRDRTDTDINLHLDDLQSFGGILLLVKKEFDGCISMVHKSTTAERMWFIMHTDVGPILLSVWYRPPAQGNISSISTLATELNQFRDEVIGTAIVGDPNVHQQSWLRFSTGNTTEGKALHAFCMENGFREYVKHPTRFDNLLDLFLLFIIQF